MKKTVRSKIRSMTGFGKGSAKSPYGTIEVEIKTLNHKSLSISCAPFEAFFLLEERIKELIADKIARGKVFVKISRYGTATKKALKKIEVNEEAIKEYVQKIKKAQNKLGIAGEVGIQDIIGFPGVVEQSAVREEEKVWPYIKAATEKALKVLMDYRSKEGSRLAKDFASRVTRIRKSVRDIKKFEKRSVEAFRKRLTDMTMEATGNEKIDNAKLAEEVALFARNADIAEEIVRLESHIVVYNATLQTARDDVGKKLDFIAQEMHRETNTIGSKASDYRISNAVIDVKSEIEKIREQLKNIE